MSWIKKGEVGLQGSAVVSAEHDRLVRIMHRAADLLDLNTNKLLVPGHTLSELLSELRSGKVIGEQE